MAKTIPRPRPAPFAFTVSCKAFCILCSFSSAIFSPLSSTLIFALLPDNLKDTETVPSAPRGSTASAAFFSKLKMRSSIASGSASISTSEGISSFIFKEAETYASKEATALAITFFNEITRISVLSWARANPRTLSTISDARVMPLSISVTAS